MSSLSIRGSRRAVFLDRDGVINRAKVRMGKPYPPASVEELEIVPDAADALADLKRHGFLLIVVTNQPDVARGRQRRDTVEQIHQMLVSALPLDQILVCYHSGEDACNCRKPSPGLLIQAAREHQVDLTQSFMVGDRWRDIDAGHNAGCKTVLIDYGYQEQGPLREPNTKVKSLREAADWILAWNSMGENCDLGI